MSNIRTFPVGYYQLRGGQSATVREIRTSFNSTSRRQASKSEWLPPQGQRFAVQSIYVSGAGNRDFIVEPGPYYGWHIHGTFPPLLFVTTDDDVKDYYV